MGNKFRLVVGIVFKSKAIQVKWFGSHVEYDKIELGLPFTQSFYLTLSQYLHLHNGSINRRYNDYL